MEKVGGRLLQEFRGKCINFLYKIKNLFILVFVSLIMYWPFSTYVSTYV